MENFIFFAARKDNSTTRSADDTELLEICTLQNVQDKTDTTKKT